MGKNSGEAGEQGRASKGWTGMAGGEMAATEDADGNAPVPEAPIGFGKRGELIDWIRCDNLPVCVLPRSTSFLCILHVVNLRQIDEPNDDLGGFLCDYEAK